MKKIVFLITVLALSYSCTSSLDESGILDRLDNLEERVTKLEELCKEMNTNISSLQNIVNALQNNDYITSVESITKNGAEIGYLITLAKSNSITIYHGDDGKDGENGQDGINGKDGYTPVIGVKQDTDGIYYWTLDGEWLLDDNGNKVKAIGTDGEDGADGSNGQDGADGINGTDGVTPQLKIEKGYWYISYDNGETWTMLGKATGENGADGKDGLDGINGTDGKDGVDGSDGKDGDSMFKEIRQDKDNVYFVLLDETEIVVPKQKQLSINFSDNEIGILAGQSTAVEYEVIGSTAKTIVKAFGQNGWSAKVSPNTESAGIITVTAPDPLVEDEIIVLVNDGEYRSIMTTINFTTGVFSSAISAHEVGVEGGTLDINIKTNMHYEVIIPENAKSWLSVVKTKALRTETITLSCAKNEGLQRAATVKVVNEYGESFSYAIFQWGMSAEVTDMSTLGTANSYIVSSVGFYRFKTTKGNSNESVEIIASAEVIWETFGTDVAPNAGDLISNISYSDNYITFRTGTTYKEGNALIAAKDENGTILWSWHIWFTDAPKNQVYNNNAGTMMDRNLGATSATKGDVGALGLFYQWGRKDPFLGSSSISEEVMAKSTITWPSSIYSDDSKGTMAYVTANPTVFIMDNSRNNDWLYTGTSENDNTRWQSAKTIYDPCPVGYRVPDGGNDGVWSTAFGGDVYPHWDAIHKGFNLGGTDTTISYLTTEECWYPATGYLRGSDCDFRFVGDFGNYWACNGIYNPHKMELSYQDIILPSSGSPHANGYSVRCICEE